MTSSNPEFTSEIQQDRPVRMDDLDIEDDMEDSPSEEMTKSQAIQKNMEARRRLEEYLEAKNLENALKDTYFDD